MSVSPHVSRPSGARPTHVLFDLDGVLLDTEPLYTRAIDAVVAPFGGRFDWELKPHTMGRDPIWAARFLIEKLALPLSPEELLRRMEEHLSPLFDRCEAMPSAESFVGELSRRGIPMAVATSSSQPLFARKTRRHAWFTRFGAVVCGDDPRVGERKPAPDIFLVAASDLGAAPASCVVVEDSPAGARAGLSAGMRVVAMPDPALSREAFPPVHRFVSGFDEMLSVVAEEFGG